MEHAERWFASVLSQVWMAEPDRSSSAGPLARRTDPLAVECRARGDKNGEAMQARQVNQVSSIAMVGLSLLGLLVVLWGYTPPPLPDEATGADTFQLSIAAWYS